MSLKIMYLKKIKSKFLIFVFCVTFVIILILSKLGIGKSSPFGSFILNLEELTERKKCPACFGVKLCPAMLNSQIQLSEWSKFSILKLVNEKNVFYATYNNKGWNTNIVLKKLAHDHELDALDRTICERHKIKGGNCDVSNSVRHLIREYSLHTDSDPSQPILHGEKIGKATDILLCPSIRKMEFLIGAAKKFLKGQHKDVILANVLTTVLINPEPLYLKAFPAENGWPFPKYYGACGRIIAEEYAGRRLTTFYKEPFHVRAILAKQLIEIANLFQDNPLNFTLYITDYTPDNFAVNEDNLKLKIIDLGELILVDKLEIVSRRMVSTDNEFVAVSESEPCEKLRNPLKRCFAYSTDDLCNRPKTDHNYFALCWGLMAPNSFSDHFPNGLLHSLPEEFSLPTSEYYEFSEYLEKCRDPYYIMKKIPDQNIDRIVAAQKLLKLLEKYTKSYSNNLRDL